MIDIANREKVSFCLFFLIFPKKISIFAKYSKYRQECVYIMEYDCAI